MMDSEKRWFDDYRLIVRVASYLVEREAMSASDLLKFLEKPWKWDDAYTAMSSRCWGPQVRDSQEMPF